MSLFGSPDIQKMKAKRDVKGLIKALNYKNDHIQREAALALGEIGDKQAVEPLIAALKDTIPYKGSYSYEVGITGVRSHAAKALGKIGDPRAVDMLLIFALGYGNDILTSSCIEALGMIGDESAVVALIQLLKDSRNDYKTIEALIKAGTSAIKPLISFFNSEHQTDELIEAILKPNNESMYYKAIKVLDKTKWQPDKSLAGAALCIYRKDWIGCGKLGAPAIDPLIGTLMTHIKSGSDEECKSAINILGEINDPQGLEQLIIALKDKRASVRKSVVHALQGNQNQQVIEPLLIALNDSDDVVRGAAAYALSLFKGEYSIDPLVISLRKGNWAIAPILKEHGWQPDQGETGAAFWIGMALDFHTRTLDKYAYLEKCAEIGIHAIEPLKLLLLSGREDYRAM
jgi:HEAT repeat protein